MRRNVIATRSPTVCTWPVRHAKTAALKREHTLLHENSGVGLDAPPRWSDWNRACDSVYVTEWVSYRVHFLENSHECSLGIHLIYRLVLQYLIGRI
jgi:hypothetical protein